MKIKNVKLIVVGSVIAIVTLVLLSALSLLKLGLIHYPKAVVVSTLRCNQDAFVAVKNYMVANRGSAISRTLYSLHDDNNGDIPEKAFFRIYTSQNYPNSISFTTNDSDLDAHIEKLLSTLTFESVYYTESCVIFPLSSPMSKTGQGILYTTTGKPAALLGGLLTTTEIGDGWYYYDEGVVGKYLG